MDLLAYFALIIMGTALSVVLAIRGWLNRSALMSAIVIAFVSGVHRIGPHIIPLQDEHYYFEVVVQTVNSGYLPLNGDPTRWYDPSRFAIHSGYHVLTSILVKVSEVSLIDARRWAPIFVGVGIFVFGFWFLNQLVSKRWAVMGGLIIASLDVIRGYYIQYHPQSFAVAIALILGGCIVKSAMHQERRWILVSMFVLAAFTFSHRFSPLFLAIILTTTFVLHILAEAVIQRFSGFSLIVRSNQSTNHQIPVLLVSSFVLISIFLFLWIDVFFSWNIFATLITILSGELPSRQTFTGLETPSTPLGLASITLKILLVSLASVTGYQIVTGQLNRVWWGLLLIGSVTALLSSPIIASGSGASPRFIIVLLMILSIMSVPVLQDLYTRTSTRACIAGFLVILIVFLGAVGSTVPVYVDSEATVASTKAAFPVSDPLGENAIVAGEFLCSYSKGDRPNRVGVGYYTFFVAGPFGCQNPTPYADARSTDLDTYDVGRLPLPSPKDSTIYNNGRIIITQK